MTAIVIVAGSAGSLAGCSTPPAPGPAALALPAADVLTSADIVPYDDGLTHLVVTTLPDAVAPDGAVDPDVAATAIGTWRRVVDRPPAGLQSVPAATPAEIDALAIAGAGSEIVEDTDGLVGEPGGRYLRSLGSLFAIDAADGPRPAEPAEPAEPAPALVGGLLATTARFATEIARIDGVVAADVVGAGFVAVAVDPTVAADVTRHIDGIEGVADVDEDVLFGLTDDPRQGEQWAITNTGAAAQADGHPGVAGVDVRAPLAWSVTAGAGTVVAVVDSGVDMAHPDLAANIWSNPGEQCGNGVDDDANGLVDDCRGWDFGDRDADPSPVQGATGWYHGTHVAGIVAAARNGTGTVGVAPEATILPLKVSDSAGRISLAAIAAAIDYASAHADVINLSLGTSPGAPREYVTGLEAAIARAGAAGVTVVAAMGNDGVDITNRPVWPASYASFYDHVIAVGASTNADTRASFSNTGAPLTIYAPGWAVMSTMPQTAWGFLYGTSMAAPVVAGAAAAVEASGSASTPGAIRARLTATSVTTSAGRRLDLAAAVGYVAPTEQPAITVSLLGADRAVADTPSSLEWVVATRDATPAVAARLSVAARDASGVGAVGGLDAEIGTLAAGSLTALTDDRGEFPIVPIDGAALAAGGASLTATMSLPPGEYAFVVELLDAAGQPVAGPVATFLSVAPPGGVAPTTVPGTPPGTVPATTIPTVTTVPAPLVAPTTLAPGATAPSTTQPAGGGGTGTPLWPTTTTATATTLPTATTIPDRAPNTPTTTPSNTPSTTPPNTPTTPPGNATPTTTPASPSPVTTSATPTTVAPPAVTAPAGGGQGTTTTTLPPPEPVRDGDYRATAISPRSGPLGGGTVVTIDGVFPASVPVYVWFGDGWSTAVRSATDAGTGTTTRLTVTTPAATAAGVRDVIVRFATDRSVELRLVDAFAYVASTPVVVTTPPTGGSGGSGTTTTPATTPATSVAPTTVTPTTVAPTTIAPPATTITTTLPPSRALGRLTLRPVASGSALASLPATSWPATGCRAASCPGTTL